MYLIQSYVEQQTAILLDYLMYDVNVLIESDYY